MVRLLQIRTSEGVNHKVILDEGITQIKVLAGAVYELVDEHSNSFKSDYVVKQKQKDLVILQDDQILLVIESFFATDVAAEFHIPDSHTEHYITSAYPISDSDNEVIWQVSDEAVYWAAGIGAFATLQTVNTESLAAPNITSSDRAQSIKEDSGANQIIYKATAESEVTIQWSLSEGSDPALTIDSQTGEVTLSDDPDFESNPGYSFTVIATDSTGQTASKAITLAIEDVQFTGIVHDDYMFGSTVFVDLDNDGVFDED